MYELMYINRCGTRRAVPVSPWGRMVRYHQLVFISTRAGQMKHLMLLRHAQAHAEGLRADYDRQLTQKGQTQVLQLATGLSLSAEFPDLVIASSAVRTRMTAEILLSQLGLSNATLVLSDDLYLADCEQLLRTIYDVHGDVTRLMLIGHNPGISDLAQHFLPTSPSLRPAQSVSLAFETDDWSRVSCMQPKHAQLR